MLPGLNFNPSFANLAALHGLGGGFPHPVGGPVRPIGSPIYPGTNPGWGGLPGMGGGLPPMAPQNPAMPMNTMGNGMYNLQAIAQLLGQNRG